MEVVKIYFCTKWYILVSGKYLVTDQYLVDGKVEDHKGLCVNPVKWYTNESNESREWSELGVGIKILCLRSLRYLIWSYALE